MPGRPRIVLPGTPLHLIQCGNNRQACFYTDEDYLTNLEWPGEYADKCDCSIHAYVLMTNYVHLLITPHSAESAGALMKRPGQRYVRATTPSSPSFGSLIAPPSWLFAKYRPSMDITAHPCATTHHGDE